MSDVLSENEIGCQINLITGKHYGECKGSCKLMYNNDPDLDKAYGYNVYVYSKITNIEELIAFDIEALEAVLDDREFGYNMDSLYNSDRFEFYY